MGKIEVVWSLKAKAQLKQIHDYFKYLRKTPQGAANIKRDILAASRSVTFIEQYQKDEISSRYRRIIVRNYKLIYKGEGERILILRIFDTKQNPKRLLEGTE